RVAHARSRCAGWVSQSLDPPGPMVGRGFARPTLQGIRKPLELWNWLLLPRSLFTGGRTMRRTTAVETPVAHLVGPGKLKVVNEQLAFTAAGQGPVRLNPAELRMVYCYGEVGVTDAAVDLLCRHGIQLAWLSAGGQRCRGRLVQDNPSAAPLRLLQ